jgi:hypothetical protein
MPQGKTKTKTKAKTKTRASASRSNGGSAVKSRAKTSASRSRTQPATKKKRASAKSRSAVSSRPRKTAQRSKSGSGSSSSNGARSSSPNGGLTQKAKGPAVAAGAMLLGLAGVAARNSKRGPRLPRPKLHLPRPKSVSLPKSGGSTIAWVGEKAKEVGDAGYRVADMTSEAAKVEKSLRKG